MKKFGLYVGCLSLAFSSVAFSAGDKLNNNKIESSDNSFSNFSLDIHLASKHYVPSGDGYFDPSEPDDMAMEDRAIVSFNEKNPGIAIKYELKEHWNNNITSSIGMGYVYNSFKENAYYISAGIQTTDKFSNNLPIGLGIDFMLVKGYEAIKKFGQAKEIEDLPFLPAALPYLRIGKESSRFTGKIGFIPKELVRQFGAEPGFDVATFAVNAKLGAMKR